MTPIPSNRMVHDSENRAGRDLRGGLACGRNINRETDCDAGKAIAKRREGQLFAEADVRKPKNYQTDLE